MINRLFATLGAVSALLAVAAGAFGAHALRARLTPDLVATFETGARYQMYHALALLLIARAEPTGLVRVAGWLFVAGSVLFSGSLYLLAVTGARGLAAVTPLGGLAFIAGWLVLALALWRG